jgi:hypothetical protein
MNSMPLASNALRVFATVLSFRTIASRETPDFSSVVVAARLIVVAPSDRGTVRDSISRNRRRAAHSENDKSYQSCLLQVRRVPLSVFQFGVALIFREMMPVIGREGADRLGKERSA